jgi:Right handed beta helix region
VAAVGGALLLLAPGAVRAQEEQTVIRVPQDVATLEGAIETAGPGDLILLGGGTYSGEIVVPEDRPGITIRGVDRNQVVFDGDDERESAIEVQANGVVLENMSAHNFEGNGFEWEGVEGFAGRYLTVWNVGLYGVYAIGSRGGMVEHSFVSGAADAAFYIGECDPCDTEIREVVARLSAIGYSGTNASGNLVIRDSMWESNGTGIMPNSYNEEDLAPQGSSLIRGNTVTGSGIGATPSDGPLGGYVGLGIAVAGGVDNVVEHNVVSGSARYGIALYPTIQREGPPWEPAGNLISGNTVSGSGTADLAVSAGSGAGNCFEDNTFDTSLPDAIEAGEPCTDGAAGVGDGDPQVAADLAISVPEALDRDGDRPHYTTMPEPDPQPTMPGLIDLQSDAEVEEPRGSGGLAWVGVLAGAAVLGATALVLAHRRAISTARGGR